MSNQIQFATVKFFAQLIKHTILIFIKAHTYGFKVARRVFIKLLLKRYKKGCNLQPFKNAFAVNQVEN